MEVGCLLYVPMNLEYNSSNRTLKRSLKKAALLSSSSCLTAAPRSKVILENPYRAAWVQNPKFEIVKFLGEFLTLIIFLYSQ